MFIVPHKKYPKLGLERWYSGIVDRAFALYVAELGLTPGIPSDPPLRSIPEYMSRSNL